MGVTDTDSATDLHPARLRRLPAPLFAFLLAACSSTPGETVSFAPIVGGDTGAPAGVSLPVGLEGAWLAVDGLELTAGSGCVGAEAGIGVRTSPGALELLGPTAFETDPTLPEGTYCAALLTRAPHVGEPAALDGATFALSGLTTSNEPFTLRSEDPTPLEIVTDRSFAMSEDAGPVLFHLDPSVLFDGVDLDAAERSAGGAVELSAERNPALLAEVEARLGAALSLYRDPDGDGRLSADERREGPLAP